MNLVNELQISALSDNVLIVLRNAMRLAYKLGRHDINEWLNSELEGYGGTEELPSYRVVSAILGFRANGQVLPGFAFSRDEISPLPPVRIIKFPVIESISTIAPLISELNLNSEQCFYCSAEEGSIPRQMIMPWITDMEKSTMEKIRLLIILNHGELKAIPERIKDKILRWALELEAAGIKGVNMSFSAKEKASSKDVAFHIRDSVVNQLSVSGRNRQV